MWDYRTHDTTEAAPGDLELLQRFLNLHEHAPDRPDDLPPSREVMHAFLVERGLLGSGEPFDDRDRARALALSDALHARIRGGPGAAAHAAAIDAAVERAGLRPRFGSGDGPALHPSAGGIDGALGRLVAIAFLSELDGTWDHLKECAGETCRSVFFDRSRNRSGKWCSMQSCGNRHKVRAWRERQRERAADA